MVPLSTRNVEMGCAAQEVIIAVGLDDKVPRCFRTLLNITNRRHWTRLLWRSELVSISMGSVLLDD